MNGTVNYFKVTPEGAGMETLSSSEIDGVFTATRDGAHELLERCALAVLNSGSESDDVKEMREKYSDFRVELVRTPSWVEMELFNAPASAFVTYESEEKKLKVKLIEGLRQHLYAVLRDLVFIRSEMERTGKFDLTTSAGITDAVFMILRNAGIFEKLGRHKVVVCWGGHAISREEYQYTVKVGHECGLRMMDVITGCGAGAMRGPMEGATIAHAKQRLPNGRYIGLTEPGIISSEPPNPIVNPLVILPDIEKRLEAFVRTGHGVIVFPGGPGTAEELMYILGILCHEKNRDIPFPLILTGPESGRAYFERIDNFIKRTLGEDAASRYRIIINDPEKTAQELNKGLLEVKLYRDETHDSYFFNHNLHIPLEFQLPFTPTHENMEKLVVKADKDVTKYASVLRRVFSAVVAGNVKPEGIEAVEEYGPFPVRGDAEIMDQIDTLLKAFIDQKRMRLAGEYKPCYRIIP